MHGFRGEFFKRAPELSCSRQNQSSIEESMASLGGSNLNRSGMEDVSSLAAEAFAARLKAFYVAY